MGGEHHIATDHRPMVQGGLLTVHPGSIHGGGEAPGCGSPLRQGAGKRSPGAPDLGSAASTEQRRDREKGFFFQGFRVTDNIWEKGGSQGAPGVQAAPLRGPTLGRVGRAPRALVGPLWSLLVDSQSFRSADFYWIFAEFLE